MIYAHVKAAVRDSGIKQRFIAEKISVTESTITAMMNGSRKITADEFAAICEILGKGMDEVASYPIRQTT